MVNSFGNCKKSYNGGPICYVNEPSNCTDLAHSKSTGRRYSWDACTKLLGKFKLESHDN